MNEVGFKDTLGKNEQQHTKQFYMNEVGFKGYFFIAN